MKSFRWTLSTIPDNVGYRNAGDSSAKNALYDLKRNEGPCIGGRKIADTLYEGGHNYFS